MASTHTKPTTRKRVIHQLDSPFSTVSWPQISTEDQDTILELLCDLLKPIGQHRRMHIQPSKGKRAARQQKVAKSASSGADDSLVPTKPAISTNIDIGFNSISRNLASSADTDVQNLPQKTGSSTGYSMVFVARGNQSSAFNSHFPQMVGVASKKLANDEEIRLVGFSKPCSERLSNCLGIARVSSVAIRRDAPGSETLWAIVKKTVTPVDIPWLREQQDNIFRPTQIAAVETTVGTKRVKLMG